MIITEPLQQVKDYLKGSTDSVTSKNSVLVPMPTDGCLLRKRLAEYPKLVSFN